MEELSGVMLPQPGETGSSAMITIQLVIDSYPSLVAARNSGGDPLEAVERAVEAALNELPGLIDELSAQIMEQYPVRMYLIEDEEGDEEFEDDGR